MATERLRRRPRVPRPASLSKVVAQPTSHRPSFLPCCASADARSRPLSRTGGEDGGGTEPVPPLGSSWRRPAKEAGQRALSVPSQRGCVTTGGANRT
eukprot:1296500-Pyramimonas_sp.AAC.1